MWFGFERVGLIDDDDMWCYLLSFHFAFSAFVFFGGAGGLFCKMFYAGYSFKS